MFHLIKLPHSLYRDAKMFKALWRCFLVTVTNWTPMLDLITVQEMYTKDRITEFRLVNRPIYWVCVVMCHYAFAEKLNLCRGNVFQNAVSECSLKMGLYGLSYSCQYTDIKTLKTYHTVILPSDSKLDITFISTQFHLYQSNAKCKAKIILQVHMLLHKYALFLCMKN